jgi:hypothetical protein
MREEESRRHPTNVFFKIYSSIFTIYNDKCMYLLSVCV